MADYQSFDSNQYKEKSFWSKPEGITGLLFLAGLAIGGGYLIYNFAGAIAGFVSTTLGIAVSIMVLGALIYMVLDPKMRNLVSYMYKSVMRWVTGIFVTIDPIGILKNYVEDLEDNLRKMSKQIGGIRGQMRKLQGIMEKNTRDIDNSMKLAAAAKAKGMEKQMVLNSRKAARLKESNGKYKALHQKMEVMYRILTKMYQNSEILLEDTKDQVQLKEQERKAIRASHSAMKSAMSVISGNPDQRAMFDAAMENIADDVANKVGEMERFMEMSSNFMNSVDLQNGVFEEQGLKMLEEYEKKSTLMLMGENTTSSDILDLDSPIARPETRSNTSSDSSYDNLFE